MPAIQKKYNDLLELLKAYSPFYLAFSGGLDSRFLAHAARRAGVSFTAVHIMGPHVPHRDTDAALAWLERNKLAYNTIHFDPLNLEEVVKGSKDRCYQCKREMFKLIQAKAGKQKVLEGSNASDKLKFRPGSRALQELGIFSPLGSVGLAKQEIRHLAGRTGLDYPAQPSRPCLLTRIDYGLMPEEGILKRLEAAEAAIAELGFENFRMRIFRDKSSVLQIHWDEIKKMEASRLQLGQLLDMYGFTDAKIHAEFEISGFFDNERGNEVNDLEILKNLF